MALEKKERQMNQNNKLDNVWKNSNILKSLKEINGYYDLRHMIHHLSGKVLEAGCGTGYLVKYLSDNGFDCYGLDNSHEAVRIAKSYNNPDKIILGDLNRIPFKNNFFDSALSLGVIEHSHNPKQMLAELCRVLKDHGILYITVPKKWHWYFFQRLYIKLKGDWKIGYEKLYSKSELLKILRYSGFKPKAYISKSQLSTYMFGFVCEKMPKKPSQKSI